MVSFVEGPVRVTVPATSANLGPGFDSLGLALSLRDELTATVTGPPGGVPELVVEVTGECAEEVPRDATHLVVRAIAAGLAEVGAPLPGLRLSCVNRIPHGRGLGSSSAAIIGGLVLARELMADGAALLDDERLLDLANAMEGHPDNVAPALLGGFVISGQESGKCFAVPSAVDPRISVVVFVPPTSLSTSLARQLLPDSVPLCDAAANAGRAALLVAALAGHPERLLDATRDYLHQEPRSPAMPDSLALVRRLRADGVPAVVSGAGPTVLAFRTQGSTAGSEAGSTAGSTGAGSADPLVAACPPGWTAHHLQIEHSGALVT